MVLIYTGKISHTPYAIDTAITVVVPDRIKDGHTFLAYWQWAVTGANEKNKNIGFNGQFNDVKLPIIECRERDTGAIPYYWFTWDLKSNILQLMNKDNEKCGNPIQLTSVYPPPSVIFT